MARIVVIDDRVTNRTVLSRSRTRSRRGSR
jgi:hypothetical protein